MSSKDGNQLFCGVTLLLRGISFPLILAGKLSLIHLILLISDVMMCRWCTEDGKKFDSELQYIEPPPPQGWYVSKEWYTVSTVSDPEGWQYSTDFTSPYWFPTADGSSTCK